jgi:broad specificity phosphatase PhoE
MWTVWGGVVEVAPRRLVLWRHGQTDYNVAGRMQGHLDSTLTAAGLAQAGRAAPLIAALGPQVMVTSDLYRASDTAAVLAGLTGLAAPTDKRLREVHLGRWQGLTDAEVDAGWPGARATWRGDAGWAPPGGESRVEVAARAAEVVDELSAEVALLCTHGELIAGLTAHLLGLPVVRWPAFASMDNCHYAVLDRSDVSWRLIAYNAGH